MAMIKKLLVVIVSLLVLGLARVPFEREYTRELTERNIMSPGLSLGVYNDLRQSSFAGVLGGLRSVVATMTHLEAHGYFENQEWYQLKKAYQTCTALDPHNIYYWQSGGWHLAYNAAADAKNNRELKSVQRRVMEREFIEQGDEFYRQGAKANPKDGSIWAEIGRLWTSPFKLPDYAKASAAWEKAAELTGNKIYQRALVYTMARVPGKEMKALAYARQYLKEDPRQIKIPTFAGIYWVLSHQPGLPESEKPSLENVFDSPAEAYENLHNYKLRAKSENFPTWGLDAALRKLLKTLKVPEEYNSFENKNPHMIRSRGWNQE